MGQRWVGLGAERLRLLRLLGRAGAGPAAALVVLEAVRAVVPTAQALAVGQLVAVFTAGAGEARLLLAAAVVAGLLFVDHTVWLGLRALQVAVGQRIDGDLRARIRLLATRLPGLDRLESREFQDRAARAVDVGMGLGWGRSAGGAATGQVQLTFRMVSAVAATALLATFSPALAVGLLVLSLVLRSVVRRQWIGIVDKLDADTAGQRYHTYLAEQAVFFAAKDVRLFGLSPWFSGRFRALAMRTYGPVWRQLLVVLRRQWWTGALSVAAAGAALGLPAAAVLTGSLDSAQLVTYVLAAWGVLAIIAMGQEAYDIEHGRRAVAAADELAATPLQAPGPGGGAVPSAAPTIRFEDVVFTYPGAPRPVLDGLTLTIRSGETVALVGTNGAGKTTLVKLLGGLYRPDSGRITVDGVDLATLDRPAWRQRLAVLFQDFVHYPADLRENVSFSAPERAGDAAVRAALDRAGGGELLAALPGGLDTSLWSEGTDGTDLSGGQWQRVALARALFAVAAGRHVLVLDEPTAHLDVRAEAEFHAAVMSTVDGVTTVLVSHRLSTVRSADRIVLLRDGRVAEEGTHAALLALGGDYARFFTVQAEAFTTDPTPEGAR